MPLEAPIASDIEARSVCIKFNRPATKFTLLLKIKLNEITLIVQKPKQNMSKKKREKIIENTKTRHTLIVSTLPHFLRRLTYAKEKYLKIR